MTRLFRRSQPGIVINERSGGEGDTETDEGPHELTGTIMPIRWEKGFSLSYSWGYNPRDDVLPIEKVLSLLVNTWVRGGNVLLNVGPDGDGVISSNQARVLARVDGLPSRLGSGSAASSACPAAQDPCLPHSSRATHFV